MRIILRQDIKKLGRRGQVVETSAGYARNFLIPKGLAEEASRTTVEKLTERETREIKKREEKVKELKERLMALTGRAFTIKAKSGKKGELFAAISEAEVEKQIQIEAALKVEAVRFDQTIKALGEYEVIIDLGEGVSGVVKIRVEPEN